MLDDIIDGFEAHIANVRLRREQQERAEAERRELERRYGLAKARRERDNGRKRLLNQLIRTKRQVTQLRDWLAALATVQSPGIDADLSRMIGWVRARLVVLELSLEPAKIAEELKTHKLFSEVDTLHDPLGDPPLRQMGWF